MPVDRAALLQRLEYVGLELIAVAVVLVAGVWLARRLSQGLERTLARVGADSTVSGFLRHLSYAALLVVTAIIALQALGVPVTSIIAVLGAAGLAIALAMKDSLSNIAAGIMLIVLRPFRDGDTVQIAGQEGTVEQIRVFQTRLRTADNRVVVLPNSSITTAPIVNFTAYPRRRIDLVVGVGYGDDLAQVKDMLLGIARRHPGVQDDPPPSVSVTRLGENGVELTLLAWAKTYELGTVRSDLIQAAHDGIIASGLSIPYPQRKLHVYHRSAGDTAESGPKAAGAAVAAGDGDSAAAP